MLIRAVDRVSLRASVVAKRPGPVADRRARGEEEDEEARVSRRLECRLVWPALAPARQRDLDVDHVEQCSVERRERGERGRLTLVGRLVGCPLFLVELVLAGNQCFNALAIADWEDRREILTEFGRCIVRPDGEQRGLGRRRELGSGEGPGRQRARRDTVGRAMTYPW